MKNIILFLSIAIASGTLFVNIYNSLVDVRAWGSDIPNSIATTREYYKTSNPGSFFRVFSPVNQILALIVLVLFWQAFPNVRLYLGAALILYILGDVFTFAYFYPRNDIMWKTAQLSDTGLLNKIWSEWSAMNWLRSLIILVGLCCSFLSLHKIYSLQ